MAAFLWVLGIQVFKHLSRMDSTEFRQRGKEMVDYIANYLDTIEERRVTPAIEPGYLRSLVPSEAPKKPEQWDDIMKDVEDKIMPGVTHWQHPRFHAYFPAGNSYPSLLGDMLSDGLGCIGFSWAASPACTELETIGSASECVLVSLLAARAHTMRQLKKQHPFLEEGVLLSKMMAYCSKEAHSCVEKAAMMAFVKLRILEPDENQSLRGATLQQVMQEDRAMGLVPFYVETTLGTTSCCSFDNLAEIGPVCEEFGAWLHVDGAYGGNSFICPELRGPMRGIEYASSFNFNPNKFMLTHFDCSLMWVRDRFKLTQALVVDPLYLQHSYSDKSIDYRHWGIPLSRRFRALKLWFVIRSFGIDGLQKYIREHCRLARRFEAHVKKESRFEVASPVLLGLVCFRLRGSNDINQKLLSSINASGKLHMVPASLNDKYVIRFCVCRQTATEEDIDYAWEVIKQFASDVLETVPEILEISNQGPHSRVSLAKPPAQIIDLRIFVRRNIHFVNFWNIFYYHTPLYLSEGTVHLNTVRAVRFGRLLCNEVSIFTSKKHPKDTSRSSVVSAHSSRAIFKSRILRNLANVNDRCSAPTTPPRSFPCQDYARAADETKDLVEAEDEAPEKLEKVPNKRHDASLKYKRSFFVRMVSDPKIYNPKIQRSLPANNPRRHTTSESSEDSNVSINSPTIDLEILDALMRRTDLKEVLQDAQQKDQQKDRKALINKTTSRRHLGLPIPSPSPVTVLGCKQNFTIPEIQIRPADNTLATPPSLLSQVGLSPYPPYPPPPTSPRTRAWHKVNTHHSLVHHWLIIITSSSEKEKKRNISSWISWPLAFLLQGVFDDLVDEPALPVRFRNWNTTLRLKGTSPSRIVEKIVERRSPQPSPSTSPLPPEAQSHQGPCCHAHTSTHHRSPSRSQQMQLQRCGGLNPTHCVCCCESITAPSSNCSSRSTSPKANGKKKKSCRTKQILCMTPSPAWRVSGSALQQDLQGQDDLVEAWPLRGSLARHGLHQAAKVATEGLLAAREAHLIECLLQHGGPGRARRWRDPLLTRHPRRRTAHAAQPWPAPTSPRSLLMRSQ
ncbi:Tyrosine decarboxylase [Chionoecetes opilio]|uniref:Tyrosine decarboxylase n=1 Tax=Chionoecetes opilio TaxID=41210 RepID=A0A8J4XPG0_CHIOP|nr:Tyrosine decarboxylase [Chionoecetes opilio]